MRLSKAYSALYSKANLLSSCGFIKLHDCFCTRQVLNSVACTPHHWHHRLRCDMRARPLLCYNPGWLPRISRLRPEPRFSAGLAGPTDISRGPAIRHTDHNIVLMLNNKPKPISSLYSRCNWCYNEFNSHCWYSPWLFAIGFKQCRRLFLYLVLFSDVKALLSRFHR